MTRILLKWVAAAGLIAGLAACNSDNNNGTASTGGTVSTPTPAPKFAALGPGFATDFAANPNSQPAPVSAGDVVAVNNTSQPVPVT